jgi:hypothetical protein
MLSDFSIRCNSHVKSWGLLLVLCFQTLQLLGKKNSPGAGGPQGRFLCDCKLYLLSKALLPTSARLASLFVRAKSISSDARRPFDCKILSAPSMDVFYDIELDECATGGHPVPTAANS